MRNKTYCWILFFSFSLFQPLKAQTTFYDVNTIQKIEVYFSQSNWDYQLDTAKAGADGYIIADWVKVNNVQYDSVGVKYKGNSSYDATYIKNPLHIELDNVINQSYQGITDIKLGNGYADPSIIREVLSYNILKNYMDCPRSNFAQLYINGAYIGLYSNDENIGKDFCSNHFYSSNNTFFKCNPIVNPGPTTKSNLRYIPLADSSGYFNFYELKSATGWNELVQLCDSVTNYPTSIADNLDMDRAMWMLAFNSVLVNLDSYTGVFCQNYYLYKDGTNRFNPIVWDLNMCLGGFPYVGSSNNSMGSLTVANMQQLPPTFHSADPYWPLINVVMNNAMFKKMYIAHARTINNENFVNNSYITSAAQLQTLVDTAVQSDGNMFFTYTQFQNGLTANQTVGSYVVPGISNLMSARVSYLATNSDFMLVPPVISSVNASNSSPVLNSTVDITANVTNTNTNAVYLGYRQSQADKFVRVLMYDDGLHNDGAAGDNVYGAPITILTQTTQYYIYAENNDAGMFSPERAEHEFYVLQTQISGPTAGQVVINEFLASNVGDELNEYGNYADWIELYNNTNNPLSLFGMYLTDDYTVPAKFAFPPNTIIQPNSYLIVWADEQNSNPGYLHCNFKLSANGEAIMLSDGGVNVIDSITFGAQSDDISMGRCPNGIGAIGLLPYTSFNGINCPPNAIDELNVAAITLYPNPFTDKITIAFVNPVSNNASINIHNVLGQTVYQSNNNLQNNLVTIDLKNQPKGVYLLDITIDGDRLVKKMVKE